MRRDHYQAITTGRGARLRDFYRSATNRGVLGDRSLSSLRTALTELGIDESKHDGYIDAYRDVAQKVRNGELTQWSARQVTDQMALQTEIALQKSDDLFGESPLEIEEQDPGEAVAAITKRTPHQQLTDAIANELS